MNTVFALLIIFSNSGGATSQVVYFKTLKECEFIHKQISIKVVVWTFGCMEVVK